MERVKIDAGLLERLKDLTAAVELVDDDGFVVAVVQPKVDPALYDPVGPEISLEEIERRLANDRRIPADEVIPRLRKLA